MRSGQASPIAFARFARESANQLVGPLLRDFRQNGIDSAWMESELPPHPSDCGSPSDEVGDKGDERDHQQQMDKPGRNMERKEAHSPQNQKH
jgi:hypothetical protein